jgi:hypothetical protein
MLFCILFFPVTAEDNQLIGSKPGALKAAGLKVGRMPGFMGLSTTPSLRRWRYPVYLPNRQIAAGLAARTAGPGKRHLAPRAETEKFQG